MPMLCRRLHHDSLRHQYLVYIIMRLPASLSQVALRAPVSVRIRRFSTPAYDIFKKIKDSNDADAGSSDDGRRKPSDRVHMVAHCVKLYL